MTKDKWNGSCGFESGMRIAALRFEVSLKQNFAKEGSNHEKIHSIWNIGFESFRVACGIVGDGSDSDPLRGLSGKNYYDHSDRRWAQQLGLAWPARPVRPGWTCGPPPGGARAISRRRISRGRACHGRPVNYFETALPPRHLQPGMIISGGGGLESDEISESPLLLAPRLWFGASLQIEAIHWRRRAARFHVMLTAVADHFRPYRLRHFFTALFRVKISLAPLSRNCTICGA